MPATAKLATAGACVALLVSSGFGLKIVANRTQVVTVDDAVARFRKANAGAPDAAAADSGDVVELATEPLETTAATVPVEAARTATTAAPAKVLGQATKRGSGTTATVVTTQTTAKATRPATPPGVYTYATTGTESVTVPGASPHTYPATTTITVKKTACGTDTRWDALEQRWDESTLCRDAEGRGLALKGERQHHEFLGQVDEKTFSCTPGSSVRPPSDEVGAALHGKCVAGSAVAVLTTTNVAVETLTIGGTAVPAMKVTLDESLEGSFEGYRKIVSWYALSNDLLLKRTMDTDTMTDSTIGRTRYREQATITLSSLTPLR